ncbi:DMT family transporter [Sulfurisoma sediminicola]|uniref:EamA-like transporter family protein n=1 Tax=Sulfurisoma sediminicola TaxID=1381557 RepID=A0A497XDM1_9PROT|nr:DMT family transporter [Sulfurisoma sediminicola]RLJ65070.1 EamA-like transporter family protein [Sulfurisoma sediminicola]
MNARLAPGPAAFALMVLLCAVWGFQQVAIKIAGAGVSPLLQVGLRSAIAAVLVFLWMRLRGQPLAARDGSFRPGLLAGALFALEFICIFVGLGYTSASRMVVFLYTAPCFTVLGLHLFVPGENIGWRHGAGVLLAFLGIAVAFGEGWGATASMPQRWIGDLLGLLAAIFWAATIVAIRATPLARISAAKVLLYQLAVSAVVALPLSWLAGEEGIRGELTPAVLLALLYLGVVVAFASYLAWFWLLTKYLASRLMVFAFLTPLFGVAFGVLLLGEPMSLLFGLAAALVVAGIVLVNAPARRPASR